MNFTSTANSVISLSDRCKQSEQKGKSCMIGGIYTHERCSICCEILKDNKEDGLVCKNHSYIYAKKCRVHFKTVKRRFNNYNDARIFLNGLRHEVNNNKFDPRDYQANNPLGFKNLSEQWLTIKENEIKRNSFRDINNTINKAIDYFQNINIKEIRPKDFSLFLNSLSVSSKTKHNHISTLKQFYRWLYDNDEIDRLPKFPKVKFNLAWRKTVNKQTQQAIINEVKKISQHNTKIWFGIKLLSTYFNSRPNEIRNILEGNIDLTQGKILLVDTKDRPKYIYLLPEDVQIFKSYPKGLPHLYFFRHTDGKQFGKDLFYTWWKKACKNLKIENVDLYGGTRHSTVSALRKLRTPEEIRLASMHTTNKAFDRYFQVEPEDLRNIYADTQGKVGKKWERNSG